MAGERPAMHHSFFHHEHVWDYALQLFKQTGKKKISTELGLSNVGLKLRAEKAGLNWTEERSTKNRHEEHVFDWAIAAYQAGEDGAKAIGKRLGLSHSSLLMRIRKRALTKKVHSSTRKRLKRIADGKPLVSILNARWRSLLKRVRKPWKRSPTRDERNAKALARYYAKHEECRASARARANATYQAKKTDKAFMAEKAARFAAYRKANPTRFATYNKAYGKRNPEVLREARRRNRKKPNALLLERLRKRLKDFVKRGHAMQQSIRKLIGCTPAHLRAHIESQFKQGMGWHNRQAWHVDHIKPCALFDMHDPVQLSQCWHWTNLQPLWASDNIAKGAQYHAKA